MIYTPSNMYVTLCVCLSKIKDCRHPIALAASPNHTLTSLAIGNVTFKIIHSSYNTIAELGSSLQGSLLASSQSFLNSKAPSCCYCHKASATLSTTCLVTAYNAASSLNFDSVITTSSALLWQSCPLPTSSPSYTSQLPQPQDSELSNNPPLP